MANINYGTVVKRRQTFYVCTCPERPKSRRDKDVIDWYMNHINTCPPRRIENIFLPAYPIEELA